MELTILGSGGCSLIPKPLCGCRICEEARQKGPPYARTGPSVFFHDACLLVDTPAESAQQLNRSNITDVSYLMFSHLDPDHVEGFRVVEQIALDFRSWRGFADRKIRLVVPAQLNDRLRNIRSIYGPLIDFYEKQGFIERICFDGSTTVGTLNVCALPVDRGSQVAFVYVFEKDHRRIVYAPCDIKPFPVDRPEVLQADLLVIQPGIFEDGLKHGFAYPPDHISRQTLYTFEETLSLTETIRAKRVLFVHLEEYWNRGYDDYLSVEEDFENIMFSYDNMRLKI